MKAKVQNRGSQKVREHSPGLVSPFLRIAMILGIGLHLVGFMFFRVVPGPLPGNEESRPFVQYVPLPSSSTEEDLYLSASLLDTAPLFVPTRWNAAGEPERVLTRATPIAFPDFEPEIDLVSELRPESLPNQWIGRIETPGDLIDLDRFNVLGELGRRDLGRRPFSDSSPVAVVESLNPAFTFLGVGSKSTKIEMLDADLSGEITDFAERPAVFRLRVSGEGRLIGEVRRVTGSGNEAFDEAGQAWLGRVETLERLPAGLLRVRLFP